MTEGTGVATGKIRGLQQCATSRGVFAILAMDHRNNLRRSLSPGNPRSVLDEELVAFKRDVVTAMASASSAVLLDLEFGAMQCIESDALPGTTGLIAAIERTGYVGDRTARLSALLPKWSPARARTIGANAVKLLVYYHPDSPTAQEIETLVTRVGRDCLEADVALFLEPLTYSVEPGKRRLLGNERRRVVLETTRRLSAVPGVDVMKVEFPVDIAATGDERDWRAVCEELTAASRVPWVLLSAGVDFEAYIRQVAIAAQAGASGVAVGRAVWKEATQLVSDARREFLATTARQRMARITALCDALAVPWRDQLASG